MSPDASLQLAYALSEPNAPVISEVPPFEAFPKIPRLRRDCIITEKIDGTNGCIYIGEDGTFRVGSRNRWLSAQEDNYGFFNWADSNRDELLKLGPGRHFGEWWGHGIQRGYGQTRKHFSLFDVSRWAPVCSPVDCPVLPACVSVVPVLYQGIFFSDSINKALFYLGRDGSVAAPGFPRPEGIVVYHTAARHCFKLTIEGDKKETQE